MQVRLNAKIALVIAGIMLAVSAPANAQKRQGRCKKAAAED